MPDVVLERVQSVGPSCAKQRWLVDFVSTEGI